MIGLWHDTVVCLFVHLSVTKCIGVKQYILPQKSEQMNRKCPPGTQFYNFQSPYTDAIPSNFPPLKPWMLVPSGEYMKIYCERANHKYFHMWNSRHQHAAWLFHTVAMWLASFHQRLGYMCVFCHYCVLGVRASARYCYDQRWLNEGQMAEFSCVEPEPCAAAKARIMKATNDLIADLHGVMNAIESVNREIYVVQ